MKRYGHYACSWLLLVLLCTGLKAGAQSFNITGGKKRVTIPFKLVRNMIIVQLNINNKGPFNFVMDTGIGLMVITEPELVDSLNITSKRNIKLYGLGGQDYEAYVIPSIQVDMPNITSHLMQAALLKSDPFGLSAYVGMPIHGLLGYDFFNSLAVRLNFGDSTMVVARPENMRQLRKGYKIPITIEDKKPYLVAPVKLGSGKMLNAKLIIDLGAGHPLSIEHPLQESGLPQNFIAANLGIGLTGPIKGYLSRINEIDLGKFKIKNVLTSFPDVAYLKSQINIVPRDGNLGAGLLKKFTVVLDYAGNAMYIKPGPKFKEAFEHDMSGMEYYFTGKNYNQLMIGRVEAGSSASEIGLLEGDEITNINFKPVSKMDIGTIDNLFRSQNGRNLLLEIHRNHKTYDMVLTLQRRI